MINATDEKESYSHLARFQMKRDWQRVELRSGDWLACWNNRWPTLRLARLHGREPELSYAAFGSFQAGPQDLLGHHAWQLPLFADGERIEWKEGAEVESDPEGREITMRFVAAGEAGALSLTYRADDIGSGLRLVFDFDGFDQARRFAVCFSGRLVYPECRREAAWAAFYGPGTRTGLAVVPQGGSAGVAIERELSDTRITVSAGSSKFAVNLYPLGSGDWPFEPPAVPGPGVTESVSERTVIETESLPRFEAEILGELSWKRPPGRVGRRVAGLFVSVPEWRHSQSRDPNGSLDAVSATMLPKVVETGCFDVIGLSRDGIYELGHQEPWLELVEQAHAAGYPVVMKPGDQELTAVIADDGLEAWADACFDVPAERRCEAVRLCWEALMWAWVPADLSARAEVLPEGPAGLERMSWPEAENALVERIADRFDRLIRLIRARAPETVIDLECGDTRVFRRLLQRHENLGVMYMCYGDYPRVGDYMDLYYWLAREHLGADRVVLETDCYYTRDNFDIWSLRERSMESLYPPEVVERMVRKHAHMNALPTDDAWAWGINLNFHEAKFEAICRDGISGAAGNR